MIYCRGHFFLATHLRMTFRDERHAFHKKFYCCSGCWQRPIFRSFHISDSASLDCISDRTGAREMAHKYNFVRSLGLRLFSFFSIIIFHSESESRLCRRVHSNHLWRMHEHARVLIMLLLLLLSFDATKIMYSAMGAWSMCDCSQLVAAVAALTSFSMHLFISIIELKPFNTPFGAIPCVACTVLVRRKIICIYPFENLIYSSRCWNARHLTTYFTAITMKVKWTATMKTSEIPAAGWDAELKLNRNFRKICVQSTFIRRAQQFSNRDSISRCVR